MEEQKKSTIKTKYGKDKFIDKKKAVTFKLVFKDSGDNSIVPSENSERVFQLIDKKNPSKDYEEYKQYLVKWLAKNDNFQNEQSNEKKQDLMEEYKKHGGHIDAEDIEDIQEIEEMEDDEDIDDIESANYEDEEDEDEQAKDKKKKIILDEKAKKALKMTEPMKAKDIELSKNVKMKLYDEYGMPLSNYDYSQHFAKQGTGGGELVFKATVEKIENPEPDIDYNPNEMTAEQKEVFEALQYEGDDPLYQELEDNFVELACQGEDDLVKPKEQQALFVFGEKKEIISKDKKQIDNMEEKLDKMLNLYEKGEEEEEAPQLIRDEDLKDFNEKKFESILNEHIEEIKGRQQQEVKTGVSVPVVIDEDQIVRKKNFDKLTYQEDLAVQQLMYESSDSEEQENQEQQISQEPLNVIQEKVEIEGTIIKNFKDQSALNFVKSTTKVSNRVIQQEFKDKNVNEEKKTKTNEKESTIVTEVDKPDTSTPFPFEKREKDMTVEEKKARKEQLKKFKKERREKKQNFKKKLQEASKAMETLQKNQQGTFSHVSLYKV